eukprot:2796875-Pleurochrysis_carterae.AAC.1
MVGIQRPGDERSWPLRTLVRMRVLYGSAGWKSKARILVIKAVHIISRGLVAGCKHLGTLSEGTGILV